MKKQELVKVKVEKARTSKNAFTVFLIRDTFSSASWSGFWRFFTTFAWCCSRQMGRARYFKKCKLAMKWSGLGPTLKAA